MPFEYHKYFGTFHPAPIFADDIFEPLTPNARRKLNSIKQTKLIESATIVSPADKRPDFYFLVCGKAKRIVANRIDNQIKTKIVLENEVFGLTELISNSKSRFLLRTITPCVFEFIAREDFLSFLNLQPNVSLNIAKIISRNLSASYRTFSSSTF